MCQWYLRTMESLQWGIQRRLMPLRLRLMRLRLHVLRLRLRVRLLLAREKQTCPRRLGEGGPWDRGENLDYWERIGGDRVCSFCGSIHPADFERFLDRVIEDPDVNVRLEQSDKQYKVYLHRPGVSNAGQGAIKYYKQHTRQLDDKSVARLQSKYARAFDVSRDKWQQWLGEFRAEIGRRRAEEG